MRNFRIILTLLAVNSFVFSQTASLPLHDFYKRHFLQYSGKEVHENLFPSNEAQLNLHWLMRDSSVQFSDFTYWLFQRHWINLEKENTKLYISPLVDFSLGDDVNRSSADKSKLFRNIRGVYVSGAIGKKFSFLFTFAENQARFMDYENAYFRQSGEYYVKTGGYNRVNAVVPGGSRTKDFKVDAFDYAYSVGMVNFQATDKLRFEFGNQSNFVGSGYRSLLLSDHTINALGLRTIYKFNDKWSYQWLIKNHRNLYRKPRTKFVESPYENKLYTAVYLTYKPIKSFAVSLFSAANALRGDSVVKHPVQWQNVLPVPVINTDLALNNKVMNGIVGLNLEWALNKWRLYGQVVADRLASGTGIAGQLGVYYFDAFGVKNWTFQLEGNAVPKRFYADENSKLSYSNAQITLAHPKGNNFAELVFRTQYKWKRIYAEFTGIFYKNLNKSDRGELGANAVITQNLIAATAQELMYTTNYQKIEIGYRFNRRYNGTVYVSFINRSSYDGTDHSKQQSVMVGLKTSLFNQYFDF